MAAMIKALNAKIRSNPTTDYLCSTRTWKSAAALGKGLSIGNYSKLMIMRRLLGTRQ